MARYLNNARALSAAIGDEFSNAIRRRGFSAAVEGVPSITNRVGTAIVSGKVAKKSVEGAVEATEKVSWVPDPKTGYYRPENTKEMDMADLRAMLLGRKTRD